MDQHEAEPNTSFFSNTTRSMFYCPHEPLLVWDFIQDTTFPWVFAAVTSIISPTAVLLNPCNHSSKAKERTAESFQYLAIKYGRYRSSSRKYMCTVICCGWTVSFLSNTGCPLQFVCWTLLRYGPRSLSRFGLFSILQWWHGKSTWPFENGLTTKL